METAAQQLYCKKRTIPNWLCCGEAGNISAATIEFVLSGKFTVHTQFSRVMLLILFTTAMNNNQIANWMMIELLDLDRITVCLPVYVCFLIVFESRGERSDIG